MTRTQPNTPRAAATTTYLHLMPHHPDGTAPGRWHVFQVSEASPRITVAATVTSWDEARTLSARAKRPLRVAALAWQQMTSAGVAPDSVPDEITID